MRVGARPLFGCLLAALALGVALPAPVEAQDPPDSVQVVPDSLQVAPTPLSAGDSLLLADSLALLDQVADTLSADTIFYNLPAMADGLPSGFATGVWEWDRDLIMASGANSLADLLGEVPGLIVLLGGDYGTPAAISAFGLGSGGVRIIRDGFELYPVDGGMPDFQRIGLGGVSRVRLDRSLGALTVELWSYAYDDGRPISVVEAGTGDLDTNIFRGLFADPTALGGSLAGALERVDTRGPAQNEGGNRTGSWLRYQLHLRERAGIAFDLHRGGTQTKVPVYASSLTRTDLSVRGRVEIVEGVVAEAYSGKTSFNADDAGDAYSVWGGSRAQHGARLALASGGAWARGGLRLFGDDELPARGIDAAAGYNLDGTGGLAGAMRRARWGDASTSSVQARGWLGPYRGLSVFGSYESGTYGGRSGPLLDGMTDPDPPFLPQPADEPPTALITDRSTYRLGGAVSVLGATFSGAALMVDNDLHVPLSTELDLGSPTEPGRRHRGVEGWGSIPLTPLWRGLRLDGSYQRWEDDDAPYMPKEIYRASLEFHRVYKETENLEWWISMGVRGHDPMSVFVADDGEGGPGGLQTVPFYQNWYTRVQVRVVTVRLFFGWENFTLRRNLQHFPDRVLPFQRSFFALRWDMWN